MIAWLRRLVDVIWFTPPQGQTLQERYPAAPGVPTFSYANVDLPDEAFVSEPRPYGWRAVDHSPHTQGNPMPYSCPWCGAPNAQVRSELTGVPVVVVQCRQCGRITKIADYTDVWDPETRLVDTSKWPPEE